MAKPTTPTDSSVLVEQRLREMADKWQDANRAVYEMCRDAAEEIRVLRTRCAAAQALHDSVIHSYPYGTGWGKGKDE